MSRRFIELKAFSTFSHSWCKKDRVNRPVQLFYNSGTHVQHRYWLRDVNQLESEAADHQVQA